MSPTQGNSHARLSRGSAMRIETAVYTHPLVANGWAWAKNRNLMLHDVTDRPTDTACSRVAWPWLKNRCTTSLIDWMDKLYPFKSVTWSVFVTLGSIKVGCKTIWMNKVDSYEHCLFIKVILLCIENRIESKWVSLRNIPNKVFLYNMLEVQFKWRGGVTFEWINDSF